jgi:hypothetical protein
MCAHLRFGRPLGRDRDSQASASILRNRLITFWCRLNSSLEVGCRVPLVAELMMLGRLEAFMTSPIGKA